MKFARIVAAATAMLGIAQGVFAQGCAMCYTQASAAGAHAQHSLDVGIIVLLLPSLVLFGGVFVMLKRSQAPTE